MIRVAHVITDLKVGGTQVALYKLLSRIDRSAFESVVVPLSAEGEMAASMREVAEVVPGGSSILRLARTLRHVQPDLVQTWLFHGDLLGGIAARIGTRAPVLWNVRASSLADERLLARLAFRASAWLSRVVPRRIVSCSVRARDVLVESGYAANRFVVIPNGFEIERFHPSAEARLEVRRELGVPADARLIGLVARWHPMKDHATFLRAAKRIAAARRDVCFVLCGDGIDASNEALRTMVDERVLLLGRRDDTPRLNAAFDIATSSSSTEGFSNSIGEAMACGVPCVATDAGDAELLIDGTGIVVLPGDDAAFAEACLRLLANDEERQRLGALARQRIVNEFELGVIVGRYEELYRSISSR